MRLVWTPNARADRHAIYSYIEAENPSAALDLDERFSETVLRLPDMPALGRPGRVPGTRELIVHPSYFIVYDVAGDVVRILRVLHTARQWPVSDD